MNTPSVESRPRLLAAASFGGHWIQLLRIAKALESDFNIHYLSTDSRAAALIPDGAKLHIVGDFNRKNIMRAFKSAAQAITALVKIRPHAVVTTGAAPGLVLLTFARLMGCKTVWIDSIANAAELSGSGRIAKKIAHRCYTQWPALATDGVRYSGNVLNLNHSLK